MMPQNQIEHNNAALKLPDDVIHNYPNFCDDFINALMLSF